jgi:ABC-type sugar transport system ATPase subunit
VGTPAEAISLGIGLVPEDRKRQGLVPQESALHNLSLAILRRLSRFGWLPPSRRDAASRRSSSTASAFVRRASIDASSRDCPAATSRRSCSPAGSRRRRDVLILDEPTRGVDVGAKAEIHALIGELARAGARSCSSRASCRRSSRCRTRIIVLRAGRLVGEVTREQATQDRLLRLMAGLSDAA